jgi:MscS family membrane protein
MNSTIYRNCLILIVAGLFTILVSPVFGQSEVEISLDPVDTSSPRATYLSFIENIEKIRSAVANGEPRTRIHSYLKRTIQCFELDQFPPAERVEIAGRKSFLLVEILGRIDLPLPQDIPGGEGFEPLEIPKWTIPGTSITVILITEGERAGEYLFSAQSMDQFEDVYEIVRNRPYRSGAWENAYIKYRNIPGKAIPVKWTKDIPSWMNYSVIDIPAWKLFTLIIAIGILIGGVYFSFVLARRIEGSPTKSPGRRIAGNFFLAVSLLLVFEIFRFLHSDIIGVHGRLQEVLLVSGYIISILLINYGIFVVFDLLNKVISSNRRLKSRGVNKHLTKVVTQILAFLVVSIVTLKSVEFLGLKILPVLAGLGIGGVAIAQAARPTLENLIGGLILFADKPVMIGDLCRYGNEEGFVEDIGLRSTRLRKFDDTLVSVPNSIFSQLELQNLSKRRKFLYHTTLQFRYETTKDQLRFLLISIREMVLAHPKAVQDKTRIRFLGFGTHSLDVEVFVNLLAADWPDSLAVREDINFRIMDIVKESGAVFAFPSTTAYIAQDAEIDQKLVKNAETRVTDMEAGDGVPFPYHSKDELRKLKGTLAYPPEGSTEAKAGSK